MHSPRVLRLGSIKGELSLAGGTAVATNLLRGSTWVPPSEPPRLCEQCGTQVKHVTANISLGTEQSLVDARKVEEPNEDNHVIVANACHVSRDSWGAASDLTD